MLDVIYNNFDLGTYSCLDGYVYTKQSELVPNPSNYVVTESDTIRIDTSRWKTDFRRDDDNIENGTGHIKYTIDELMIMRYGMVKYGFPLEVKMEDCLNKEYKFNLPSIAGVLRLCCNIFSSGGQHYRNGITLYINNVKMPIDDSNAVSYIQTPFPTMENAINGYGGYAFKISEELFNTEVRFTTNANSGYHDFIFYFLPYIYPVEGTK